MRDSVKKLIDRLAMFTGLFMVIGLVLEPNFRVGVANLVGFIFAPLTALPVHWAILIISLLTGIITSVIQKYTMYSEDMRETQQRMKKLQEEMKEARLEDNEAKLEKLQSQQKEMMGDFLGVQKQMIKPMLYIMAITVPMFAWIYIVTGSPEGLEVFSHGGEVPIGLFVPFFGKVLFTENVLIVPGGIFWYLICSLPLSQLVRKVLNVRTPG